MGYRKITAIIRTSLLKKVEDELRTAKVRGLSISQVKGYGDYADLYRSDWLTTHARIEIFTAKEKVKAIVDTIITAAYTGAPGDGLIAILPVEEIFRIKDRKRAHAPDI